MKPGANDELYFGSLRNITIILFFFFYVLNVCELFYIVSFVVKSPSGEGGGGKNP